MAEQAGSGLDTSRPHPARVYDYLIGGKSNFAADRALAEKMLQETPGLRTAARENRAFLGRAVQYLAGEAGVRQFLDIGTGLPTVDNVHEVAQRIAPESRVVYADNDPMVLAHARELLTSAPEGRTAYVHADLRDPARILADPRVRDVLDFGRPVALVLVAVLHFLPDEDKPAEVVAALLDALPSGSYLVASHTALDHAPAPVAAMERAARAGGIRPSNATPATSPGSRSRAWNLSRRASSSSPSGAPATAPCCPTRTRSTCTAASPASPRYYRSHRLPQRRKRQAWLRDQWVALTRHLSDHAMPPRDHHKPPSEFSWGRVARLLG